MNIILLSGGSGKRLWPLSNDVRSKQFIKMFRGIDGELESMLTRVFRQITSVDPEARITIATSRKQASTIKNQLGEQVNICVEPERRDTFPAICLAAAYLHDELGVSEEEAVVVCPVDPYVQDTYFEALERLADLAQQGSPISPSWGSNPPIPARNTGISYRPQPTRSARSVHLRKSRMKRRPGNISPRAHCGTVVCLPLSWDIC